VNIYTDAREQIVTALQAAGLTAYGYTPPTLVPPCVIVEPADEWIAPDRVGGKSYAVTFTATAHVNLIDSATAISSLEELVAVVLPAIPAGVFATSVEAPAVDGTGSQGETLAAAINLTAQVKE
jgi:hypothetical protein